VVRGRTGIFRLAAIDLDGTLLRSDGTIGERTKRAVRETRLDVVLVTARGPLTIHDIAAELELRLVHELRERLPGIRFAVEHESFAHEPGFSAWNWTPPAGTRVADVVELLADPATKLILRHADHDTVAIQDLARELVGERLTVVASGSEAVEVTAAGVNKATAVAELGVPPEQVIAFGDYPNDIPLLTWAGRGVAMSNAHADVLAVANEVTATNDEDGVALVLERLAQ
jgi:hydroxymethylpyrimidine pyrophosphatase-like HAD family hydrolase